MHNVKDYISQIKGKSMKGKNDILFLVNDSNNEILQHYSDINNFDNSKLLLLNKINYNYNICLNNSIKYYFFIIPDKSVVLKEYLPFKVDFCNRISDLVNNNIIIDLYDNTLNEEHYFKYDSHINYIGALNFIYKIIKYINIEYIIDDFNKLFNFIESLLTSDLLSDINYMLPEPRLFFEEKIKSVIYNDNNKISIIDLTNNIPNKYSKCKDRESLHYKNSKSLTELRVLILRDSSTNLLIPYLMLIFNEIFLYWDHFEPINLKLIEFYKPDIILDIRTERFLNF